MQIKSKVKFETVYLYLFMLLPILTVSLNLDNDFWFLINQGRYIINYGFPTIEPFTFHTELQFMIQQWLFDVLVYFLYSFFGKAGVMIAVYSVSLIAIYLIFKICMLLSDKQLYLSVLISAYMYLLMCLWFMVSRPQIITYLVLLIEIYCLELYAKTSRWQYLIPLPLLSVFQINSHASMWWMIFVFMLPYIVETIEIRWHSLNHTPLRRMPIMCAALLMILAGAINPYGVYAISYVFRSFGDDMINSSILEMGVPDIKTFTGIVFYLTLLVIILFYCCNRKSYFRLRYVLLTIGSSVLALMAVKSIPYFLVGAWLPLAFSQKELGKKLVFTSRFNSKKTNVLLCAFLVIVVGLSCYAAHRDYDEYNDYPDTKEAIEYFIQNEDIEKAKVYTSFYDGGYAEFRGIRAYIDARAEVFLKTNNGQADIFHEYIKLQRGGINCKEFLKKYNFSHVLITETDVLSLYLPYDDDYYLFYEDDNCKIYKAKS